MADLTRQMASELAEERDDRRRDTAIAAMYLRPMNGRRRDSESSGNARITAIAAILIPR